MQFSGVRKTLTAVDPDNEKKQNTQEKGAFESARGIHILNTGTLEYTPVRMLQKLILLGRFTGNFPGRFGTFRFPGMYMSCLEPEILGNADCVTLIDGCTVKGNKVAGIDCIG